MNTDPASLDNLRDIAELPPVPWWPLAPGWYVLLAILAIGSGIFAFRALRQWRANAYRRAALSELGNAPDLAAVADILKRTALATHPRSEVASLTGEAWLAWLSTHGPAFPGDARTALLSVYQHPDTPAPPDLVQATQNWIRHSTLDTRHSSS